VTRRGDFCGHLDNFVGVHAVMRAYFSGEMDQENVAIELTYGEETGMAGAREVLARLSPADTVIVVDVTGAPTAADITIEKCVNKEMQSFLREALRGIRYDLYEGCPDPVASADETDVYREKVSRVCFLGIPCTGGDYNAGEVTARKASVEAASRALIRIARHFRKHGRSGKPAGSVRERRRVCGKKAGRTEKEDGKDFEPPDRASTADGSQFRL